MVGEPNRPGHDAHAADTAARKKGDTKKGARVNANQGRNARRGHNDPDVRRRANAEGETARAVQRYQREDRKNPTQPAPADAGRDGRPTC